MRKEYKDKINLATKMLILNRSLPIDELEKRFNVAYAITDELSETRDSEILEKLLEFFNKENEMYGGFCENLKSQICINFTLDQLMQAFYKKFDYLVKNDLEMSYEMSSWFLYSDMFNEFREMFNTVKSADSNVFIDRLDKWCGDEFPDEIALLREDMKKW